MIDWGKSIAISIFLTVIIIIVVKPEIIDEIKEKIEGIGHLSPSEVRKHPEKYLDKNITIRGYYTTFFNLLLTDGIIVDKMPSTESEYQEALSQGLYVEFAEGVTAYDGAKYDFTGRLKGEEVNGIPIFYVYKVKSV